MILSSHGLIASSILQVDADWLAYYNRVIAAGGSLTTTEQAATLQLVLDLKANSLWTPMKAIYPMVGGGNADPAKAAAACKQNLKSSSFTGTFTSGWTFASTGVTPNGVSAYMDTGFNSTTQLISLSSFHFSVYLRTNIGAVQIDIGAETGTFGTFLFPSLNGQTYARLGNTYADLTSITDTRAFFQVIRLSSTNTKYFVNNVKKEDSAVNLTAYPTQNILLGALGSNGNVALYSTRQNAFASIGDGLTDTQASNFYTAVQAFQTTLSRNV
jgi:hypothetical protein